MNRFACSEALDCMEAYYKVALKRFIDDIAIEAIEAKLISQLGDIFSSVAVSAIPADLVTCIAGESEENRAQREQLTKQLDVLTKGSDTCKRFIGIRLLDADDGMTRSEPEFNSYSENQSNDFDDSFQEDVRSLMDRSFSRRSPPIEESESLSRDETLPEVVVVTKVSTREAPEKEFSFSSKKKSKRSKISAARSIFEQE